MMEEEEMVVGEKTWWQKEAEDDGDDGDGGEDEKDGDDGDEDRKGAGRIVNTIILIIFSTSPRERSSLYSHRNVPF